MNYIPRKDLDQRIKNGNSETEMKWIEIVEEKRTNKIIGIIYRHPNKIENDFNLALSKILCKIKKEKKRIIVAGDFNYDVTYTKNEKVNELIILMYENLCQPCILKPTRIVENQRPSLIDNIFINSIESPVSGNPIERLSDHFPNFLIINNNYEKEATDKYNYERNLKAYDPINFQQDRITKFDNIHDENQIVTALSNNTLSAFKSTLDTHAPIVKRTKKRGKKQTKTMAEYYTL